MKLINANFNLLKHKNYIFLLLLFFGMTAITACSSGSTSTATGGGSTALTGVFLDSPVGGLNYQTATMSGLTDEDGTFMYHEGETVTFMIGDVILGSAPGHHTLTPIDLVPGAVDETDPTVTNICRLLQSIDWDRDLTNGIMITETTRSEMSGRMIDFTKGMDEFNDYDVQAFFDTMHILGGFHAGEQRGLRTPVETQDHFRQTLMDNGMYYGNSSFGPDQSQTGMGGMPRMNSAFSDNAQDGSYNLMNN